MGNNIKTNAISEIDAKKDVNALNKIQNLEIIKYKKRTPRHKKLLNLFNDLSDIVLTDKTLESESQENENEKVESRKEENEKVESRKEQNEDGNHEKENEYENENDDYKIENENDDHKNEDGYENEGDDKTMSQNKKIKDLIDIDEII